MNESVDLQDRLAVEVTARELAVRAELKEMEAKIKSCSEERRKARVELMAIQENVAAAKGAFQAAALQLEAHKRDLAANVSPAERNV